jgi:CRP-like cAMP-binding protein
MLFRSALAALQNQLAEHEVVRIAHVPANLVRAQRQLLFELSASSKAPDNVHVDLPRFMFPVVYDTARRTAEALRIGREHLTVGQVVERLKRDVERALAPRAERPSLDAQQPGVAAGVRR